MFLFNQQVRKLGLLHHMYKVDGKLNRVRVEVQKQQDPSMRQIPLSTILISAETEHSVIIPFYK